MEDTSAIVTKDLAQNVGPRRFPKRSCRFVHFVEMCNHGGDSPRREKGQCLGRSPVVEKTSELAIRCGRVAGIAVDRWTPVERAPVEARGLEAKALLGGRRQWQLDQRSAVRCREKAIHRERFAAARDGGSRERADPRFRDRKEDDG